MFPQSINSCSLPSGSPLPPARPCSFPAVPGQCGSNDALSPDTGHSLLLLQEGSPPLPGRHPSPAGSLRALPCHQPRCRRTRYEQSPLALCSSSPASGIQRKKGSLWQDPVCRAFPPGWWSPLMVIGVNPAQVGGKGPAGNPVSPCSDRPAGSSLPGVRGVACET